MAVPTVIQVTGQVNKKITVIIGVLLLSRTFLSFALGTLLQVVFLILFFGKPEV